MSVAELMGTIAAGIAILGGVVAGVRWAWGRYRDNRPPLVSVATDVSLDRKEFPPDRYASGWGRNLKARYTVIEVRNRRGKVLTLAGTKLEFVGLDYPVWIQATNAPRELEPKELTHFYFERDKYAAPVPKSVTVRWLGGEHTYRGFPHARGWTDPPDLAH